jgi:hypothetical protein
MTSKSKLIVPKGLDEKLFAAQYETALQDREKRFKLESARLAELQKVRIDMAAEAARSNGITVSPPSEKIVAFHKQTLKKLGTLRPIHADTPSTPIDIGPPYAAALPPLSTFDGPIESKPWNNSPDPTRGELGGVLGTWAGGQAMLQTGFVIPAWARSSGTYQVEVVASMKGIYYLHAPAYGIAEFELDLFVVFIDEVPEPSASYMATANIGSAITPFFSGGTQWDYLDNLSAAPASEQQKDTGLSFTEKFTFPMGDAPGPIQVQVGLIQKIAATPGAIASVDPELTIQSISIA